MKSSWLLPGTAFAQRNLVVEQLKDLMNVRPFSVFLEAMRWVDTKGKTILDVGCGVGHYGAICHAYYPKLCYMGTDFSQAMIDQAWAMVPQVVQLGVPFYGAFTVCKFEDNNFGDYDIVLVSQVMEYTADPWASLRLVMEKMKTCLILHRLRVTDGPSHADTLPSYGHVEQNFVWNIDDILKLSDQLGIEETHEISWDDMATLVLKR